MIRTIDKIGGLLVKPEETVTTLLHGAGRFAESIFIVVLFSAAFSLSVALIITRLVSAVLPLFPMPSLVTRLTHSYAAPAIIGSILMIGLTHDLINFFVGGLVTHAAARLLGGAGELSQVLLINGYTWVSLTFMLAGCIVAALNFLAGILVLAALALLTWVWHIYLFTLGVSESHGISTGKALLAVLSWDVAKVVVLVAAIKILEVV